MIEVEILETSELKRPAPSGNFTTEQVFQELASRWRNETRHLSSVSRMALHPAYQRIIGMGKEAVPLILKELQERGGHWLWALHAITGEDPAPPEATFHEAVQAWLKWGKSKDIRRHNQQCSKAFYNLENPN